MVQVWQKAVACGAALFLALMLTGQAQAPATATILTPQERAWLAAHPVIRLTPPADYQPIDFFDEQGRHAGITADYLVLLEQRLGLHFQIIRVDLTNESLDLDDPVQLGADVKVAITETPKRAERWLFTQPYLEVPAYIITRKEARDELTLEHLEGDRVAVVWHYAAHQYLADHYPKLILDPVVDTRMGLRKVSFGLTDAFVSELPVATYWMERQGITNLKVSSEAGYLYRLSIASRKDWPELHRILEKGLALITPEERAAIYRKWVKMPLESLPFSRGLGLTLLSGLGVIGLGLLGVLWWNRSLAAQVRQRTAELQQDLQERRKAEQALQESEEQLRTIIETSPECVKLVDRAGLLLQMNQAGLKMIGAEGLAEMRGKCVYQIIAAEYREAFQQFNERICAGEKGSLSFEIIGLDGTRRWIETYAVPVYDKKTQALVHLAIARDITDHKRAEEALRQSEELFRSLSETTSAWVYIVQRGRICYINSAAVAGSEYSREELLGKQVSQLVHPDDWHWLQSRAQARKLGQDVLPVYEARAITKSGRVPWLQVASNFIEYNHAPAELCTAMDITDRKLAQEALQQSEELFRSLTETTTAWVYIIQKGRLCYVNPAAEAGFGYSVKELPSVNYRQVIHPEDQDWIRERWLKRLAGQSIPTNIEIRIINKDGTTRWLQVATKTIQYQQEFAELNTAIDITERKQAEQALQQSEELFRSLTETTTAWVYVVQDNHICYLNSAVEVGMETSREEFLGTPIWSVVHPDDLPKVQTLHQNRHTGYTGSLNYENRVITSSGKVVWLQVATNPIVYQNRAAELCTSIDITERKLAEEQIKISEQQLHQLAGYLQTVREDERTAMAREIHDELGQALTAMKIDIARLSNLFPGQSELVQSRLGSLMELINSTINTVRKLASQLRPGVLDDLGLAAAVEWQAQEFQTRTGIACDFAELSDVPDLAPERATAIFRICQEALTNVARHAQATRVTLRLQKTPLHVRLEVKDNGRGVTAEERVNPRSLGLLGMRERAFLLGGEFTLEGKARQGTTVTVQIPRQQAKAQGGAL